MSKLLSLYLKIWAKLYLTRAKPKIIAITGSVGKTSTKEAIFEVLKIKFGKDVRKSEGNLNNQTGLPLAILNYQKAPSYGEPRSKWLGIILSAPLRAIFSAKTKLLVLEMAADKPGDMDDLLSIVKPNVSVITNIGLSHLEQFKTKESVFNEKTKIIKSLNGEDWVVLNTDDENLAPLTRGQKAKVLTYSISRTADFQAQDIKTKLENQQGKTTFVVAFNQNHFSVELNSLGNRGNIYAALAAVALGKIFALSSEEINLGLKKLRPLEHRMEVIPGRKGLTIIDDAYNASPASMEAALITLEKISGKRKIAVLGEMRELGTEAVDAHLKIGKQAQGICDEIIAVGGLSRYYGGHFFATAKEATEYLLRSGVEGDIILIKASRGAALKPQLAEIVEALRGQTKTD